MTSRESLARVTAWVPGGCDVVHYIHIDRTPVSTNISSCTGRKVEFPGMHFISEIANFLIQGGINIS